MDWLFCAVQLFHNSFLVTLAHWEWVRLEKKRRGKNIESRTLDSISIPDDVRCLNIHRSQLILSALCARRKCKHRDNSIRKFNTSIIGMAFCGTQTGAANSIAAITCVRHYYPWIELVGKCLHFDYNFVVELIATCARAPPAHLRARACVPKIISKSICYRIGSFIQSCVRFQVEE